MKYLILLFLVITSCTDKEDFAHVLSNKNIIEEVKVIEPEPVIASYDKGLDLILIGSDFKIWQIQKQTPTDTYTFSEYWDTHNNVYYFADLKITNNILYNIDTNLQYEKTCNPAWIEKDSKYGDTNILAELLYVGSLEPLKRIYYDPINKIQYIKTLNFINTDKYKIEHRNPDGTSYYETIYTDLPVYPTHEHGWVVYLTNIQNQKFFISIDGLHLDNGVEDSDGDY